MKLCGLYLRHKISKIFSFVCFFILVYAITLYAEDDNLKGYSETKLTDYPVIESLSSRNIIFSQYIQDVEESYKSIASGKNPSLVIYVYNAQKQDTLFTVAARCSIPYETIAGLNGIASTETVLEGKRLYLPTVPGLFYAAQPVTIVDKLLYEKFIADSRNKLYNIEGKSCFFIVNGRFSSTERAFFLDSSLKLPLTDSVLTSSYGMRISPITGNLKFHEGIDLAAPTGTSVFACKKGTIKEVGYNNIYGNYIIIHHEPDMDSKYAHLSEVKVNKNQLVAGGDEIGLVGETGEVTGPHLHFEILVNGKSVDPELEF